MAALCILALAACEGTAADQTKSEGPQPHVQTAESPPDSGPQQPTATEEPADNGPGGLTVPPAENDAEARLRAGLLAMALQFDQIQSALPDDFLDLLKDSELITKTPSVSADYVDYYLPTASARFLGYPLLAIESEDIRGPWNGCCVNRGLSVVLDTGSDADIAKAFAAEIGCSFERDISLMTYYGEFAELRSIVPRPGIAMISCRESDVVEH